MSLTLKEHLELGKTAIKEFEPLRSQCEPLVCFHFSPPPDVDAASFGYGTEWKYSAVLEKSFEELGIDGSIDATGGEFGFEIWERSWPSEDWLQKRVLQMLQLASEVEHVFQGWTFEPHGGPVVSAAADVGVWNADTPEGQEKIQQVIDDVERSRKAEDKK